MSRWQLADTGLFLQIHLQRQNYDVVLAICLLSQQQLPGAVKIPFQFLL